MSCWDKLVQTAVLAGLTDIVSTQNDPPSGITCNYLQQRHLVRRGTPRQRPRPENTTWKGGKGSNRAVSPLIFGYTSCTKINTFLLHNISKKEIISALQNICRKCITILRRRLNLRANYDWPQLFTVWSQSSTFKNDRWRSNKSFGSLSSNLVTHIPFGICTCYFNLVHSSTFGVRSPGR